VSIFHFTVHNSTIFIGGGEKYLLFLGARYPKYDNA